MTDHDLKSLRHRLDMIEAVQQSMTVVLSVLLQRHQGDPEVFASLQSAFDRLQSAVLGSQSTDDSIDALAELAASYLQLVKPPD